MKTAINPDRDMAGRFRRKKGQPLITPRLVLLSEIFQRVVYDRRDAQVGCNMRPTDKLMICKLYFMSIQFDYSTHHA